MSEQLSWRTMPQPIPDEEITQTYQCDVLVVGAAHSGTMVMEAAVDGGASVIALEKKTREKFHVNGAEVGHINSEYLRKRGVPEVDPIDLFNEWLRRAGNRANQSLVMKFCQNCGEAFDEYISVFSDLEMEEVRVKYWPEPKHFERSLNGYKTWPGTALFPGIFIKGSTTLTECIKRHHARAAKKGAVIHYGTEALYPILENGRVAGSVAKCMDGSYARYMAQKGVVLAAGDFGGNQEMSQELLVDVVDLMDEEDKFFSLGMGDGRGIQMGVWAGGCMESRPVASMGGNSLYATAMMEGFGCLWLNENGKRYCNEMFSGDSVVAGLACNQEKHGPFYSLFDSSVAEHLQYGPPCHASFDTSDPASFSQLEEKMQKALAAGAEGCPGLGGIRGSMAYGAETWEELAEYLGFSGMRKETFLKSVARYNQLCENKRDEDFGKDPSLMIPLNKPPFYGVMIPRTAPGGSLCTVGGLVTDENQQVLNKRKDPIPGLYATGNCCGRRFGAQYATPIAGVSISMALTLGRELGKFLAEL